MSLASHQNGRVVDGSFKIQMSSNISTSFRLCHSSVCRYLVRLEEGLVSERFYYVGSVCSYLVRLEEGLVSERFCYPVSVCRMSQAGESLPFWYSGGRTTSLFAPLWMVMPS